MGVGDLPQDPVAGRVVVHGSCVAVGGHGALILGRSGAGKSALALQMMAHGARLVGDDRIALWVDGPDVMADGVDPIRGLIEARGIGLLRAEVAKATPVRWLVDLDRPEPERLPEPKRFRLLGQSLPLLRAADTPNLAAALMQLMKMGRVDPQWPSN